MKKFLGILVLGLLWCNMVYALPACEGDDYKKWTMCEGTVEADGKKYVGEWKKGIMHGQGTYTWPDGTKYVGERKNGRAYGQGTLTHPSGDKYVGSFKNDKKHGHGTSTFLNGGSYVGEWENDMRHGQGTETSSEGDIYVGGWKKGKTHGQGTVTFNDGTIIVAKFQKDQLIKVISRDTSARDKAKKKMELDLMVEEAKKTCKDLGFTEGTDKFSDCSLKLYTLSVESAAKNNQTVVMQPQSSGSNTITIYDPVRDSNALINKGMRMLSGACTFGINC